MVEIVNVVSSGALNVEINLERLADDIGEPVARYDPNKYPGMYLRLNENEPLITLYRTGKYIITGADSADESYSLRKHFLSLLSDMGVIENAKDEWFSIQNYVCIGELKDSQNLNALAIGLGLEKTEYEPEQFPGLIYRPDTHDCVVLIFATGRVVLTGASDFETAKQTFKELQDTLS
ncbi:TATA-box-binding protein C [Haladaptatus sp. W1]|uniref:TATA-box-binding protein n=1 Tax=Haladaptatus sp. W1 TaxID=1897478 RepID=UPI000849B756|nr:TATA-box-binding protein [Haladaptatus sp. W1]ODR80095.1 TATA-box-binding protein C [Haladaptatus sp. W1]